MVSFGFGKTVSHNTKHVNLLEAMFLGHMISRFGDTVCPARFPDLFAPDHFLWEHFKARCMQTNLTHSGSRKSTSGTKLEPLINVCCSHGKFSTSITGMNCMSGRPLKNIIIQNINSIR
jgi:hypothetical protein